MIGLPQAGQQNRTNHARQQQEIPFAGNAQIFIDLLFLTNLFHIGFTRVITAVDNIKHQQQHHRTDQYGHQHVFHRPHEIHALQEA